MNILGCIKDSFDKRDYIYEDIVSFLLGRKKRIIDLRDEDMPEVVNQERGSCAFHCCSTSYEYQYNKLIKRKGLKREQRNNYFSRMFNYFLSRKMVNKIGVDSGSTLRNACKTYYKYGTVKKEQYYNDNRFYYSFKPSFDALFEADNNKINAYYRIISHIGVIDNLEKGVPVIIGTDIHAFNDCDKNGKSKDLLELDSTRRLNHAMLIVGFIPDFDYYGQKLDCYIVRNSHDKDWGDNGYCYLPVDIMWKYNIGDAWVIIKDKLAQEIDSDFTEKKAWKWFKNIF